ncbi:MAG: polysaccharide deacetylase family protein [Paraclostridium sp.]
MRKFSALLIALLLFFSISVIEVFCSQDEDPNDKVVYITFDDGPNTNTPKILDLLAQYNMKATFFLLEDKIKSNPDIVKRMLSEGHAIGLHGQSHEKKLFYADNNSVLNEIYSTRTSLKNIVGYDTNVVRVPYGSKPHLTQVQYSSLVDNGYNMWDWNVDSTDTHANASASSIINNTLSEVKNYKTPVVLFHDKQVTVKALPSVLKFLYTNGYISKTIQQQEQPLNWWNKLLY